MDLLRKMLAADPKHRISAKLALSHGYFESVEMKGVSSPALTFSSQGKK
jgi:serine/threonine protein kinase